MKNHECPHMAECEQLVLKHDFEWKCLGKISWSQENCFKTKMLGIKGKHELPRIWWANKLGEKR
jgi:hypothetical protein